MYKLLLFCFILLFGLSCKTTQKIDQLKYTISPEESQYDLLQGNWRLTSFSAFMAEEKMDKMPDYSQKAVWYAFSNKNSKLIVSRDHEASKYDYSLPSGEYRIWANRSMVKIENQLYMCHVSKDELILDSNYDPSYGPDGPVLSFTRAE